ncbi:MAG: AsmA-like C-terminal domain-containing protein [Phycisphaerae bacterium]
MPTKIKNNVSVPDKKKSLLYRLFGIFICVGLFLAGFKIIGHFLSPLAVEEFARITQTRIRADSVDVKFNGSITIQNLQISPEQQRPYDNTILRAKKLNAKFGLISLVSFRPKLKRISIADFILDVQENLDDGRWNVDSLVSFPSRPQGGRLASIKLKNGRINYSRAKDQNIKIIASVGIQGKLEPSGRGYIFELDTAKIKIADHRKLKGSFEPGKVSLSGDISTEDLPIFESSFRCRIDKCEYIYDSQNNYTLEVLIDEMAYKTRPAVFRKQPQISEVTATTRVFDSIHNIFDGYDPSGIIGIELKASGNWSEPNTASLDGAVICKGVRIRNRKFPYTVENITGPIVFTEKLLKVGPLKGNHGLVKLEINGQFDNLGPNIEGNLHITSDNMILDQDLYNALNEKQQKLWNQFEPTGITAFKYSLNKPANEPSDFGLDVQLLDVNSTFEHFPYPLEQLTGNLFFDSSSIKVTNLRSQKDERAVLINGILSDTNTNQPKYDLIIDVENLPLDDTLALALPQRQRNVYNQFKPSGFADGSTKIVSKEGEFGKINFVADLAFRDTSLQPSMLSRAVTDIKAAGQFRNDSITFSEFNGLYANIPVSLTGRIEPCEKGDDIGYELTITGEDAELGEEMFELIPQDFKGFINEFQPSGTVDYSAVLKKDADAEKPDYNIELNCKNVAVNSSVLQKTIKNIQGRLFITPNDITFIDIEGKTEDNSPVTLNGSIVLGEISEKQNRLRFTAENFVLEHITVQQIQGDIGYDRIGRRWVCDNFTARLHGGNLAGRFSLGDKDNRNAFEFQSGFKEVSLQEFLKDQAERETAGGITSGTLNGSISLSGSKGQVSSYFGTCTVNINDIRIGRLSPVARVLSALKLQEPADYAFENMSFDSYIKSSVMYFERFELTGKTLNFTGKGTMEINSKNLDLKLAVRGPRLADIDPPLIGFLTDILGQAVLGMEVTGNINNPQVTIQPLPLIKGLIELFGIPNQ